LSTLFPEDDGGVLSVFCIQSEDIWRTSCTALWPGQEWDERSWV